MYWGKKNVTPKRCYIPLLIKCKFLKILILLFIFYLKFKFNNKKKVLKVFRANKPMLIGVNVERG